MDNARRMAPCKLRPGRRWLWLWLVATVAAAQAQTCQSAEDLDAPVRTALETTAKKYFDMSARGDTAGLQQNSIPSVAASFGGIEAAVKDNQSAFASAQATTRPPFVLMTEGTEPMAHAEFLCGVFGKSGQTSDSAVFVLNNLPPGKYGVVLLDAKGSPDERVVTLILQQIGEDWKLAGFYVRPSQIQGHDGAWFAQRAREFKAKGQTRNAWFYYQEAISLSAPADFMSTLATDRLYDEGHSVLPEDLPSSEHPLDLSGGGKTYRLTTIFLTSVGSDLDLVVKYQATDVSNSGRTFQENKVVMQALVAKFPEFRDAFAGIVARAVEPSGKDFGSMLPMKEIK